MDKIKHLAIASVPIQTWGEVYQPAQALKEGTIFAELNMPFFMAEAIENPSKMVYDSSDIDPKQLDREVLMQKICEVSFVTDDLNLYVDMHCEDEHAKEKLKEFSALRKELMKIFAEKFYPLTRDCVMYGNFENGPMPWEGACI